MKTIDETQVSEILAFLKARKKGGKLDDVYGVTRPDRKLPVNCWEGMNSPAIDFFDDKGMPVASSVPDDDIHLVEVVTVYGRAVWVRAGYENLLVARFAEAFRLRKIEFA